VDTGFSPITNETELDEVMTCPGQALVAGIGQVQSPLVILGGGGKMGPSLAVQARRAAQQAGRNLRVISVSRFSDAAARQWLEARGVETLSLDLMERASYARLPDSANLLYLLGLKFGTTRSPASTWATMALPPAMVCERYPGARISALSSGNVYPFVPVDGPAAREEDELTPLGEYANACVSRERVFEFCAQQYGVQLAQVRLFYAVDLRYGVLLDIAQKVWAGQAVDVTSGYLNCIWQADANQMALQALAHAAAPPFVFNLTGSERLAVRALAQRLAALMAREVTFTGSEAPNALLGDTTRMCDVFGQPPTPLDWMLRWTAAWVAAGGRTLNKPTHFDTRDGRY
jgi:nucleoside-diphosphate-sugar epimerase